MKNRNSLPLPFRRFASENNNNNKKNCFHNANGELTVSPAREADQVGFSTNTLHARCTFDTVVIPRSRTPAIRVCPVPPDQSKRGCSHLAAIQTSPAAAAAAAVKQDATAAAADSYEGKHKATKIDSSIV